MKKLSFIFLTIVVAISSAFTQLSNNTLYPELEQSFKLLKKNLSGISFNRRDELLGVQQMGIIVKQQKKPVVIELISNDGFTAQYAKGILCAALASNNIIDVKVLTVGSSASDKVIPALLKIGFKPSDSNNSGVKYNEQDPNVNFTNSDSKTESIHVLMNDNVQSLLTSPDKFAIKLKYPNLAGSTDEQYQVQAKLIATEMLFIAMKIKDN